MNSQNKIIGDILSLYDTILKNKNLSEASDIYDNVNFKDNIVPNCTPSKDNINLSLLQDIQTAAKSAGLNVDITTAISGHNCGGRHTPGNAVDIAIINNKSVNKGNTADADKLTATLEKMGYVRNSEGSNVKSVLWKMPDGTHYDHVHISNIGKSSSPTPTETIDFDKNVTKSTNSGVKDWAKKIGTVVLSGMGISETVKVNIIESFGYNPHLNSGVIILPKDSNPRIKSPVDGVIVRPINITNCLNPLAINPDNESLILQYCGLKPTTHKIGKNISEGELLGYPENDVKIKKYKKDGSYIELTDTNLPYIKPKELKDKRGKNEISKLLFKIVDDSEKWFEKDEPKKLKENINRIKGLLK